MNIIGISSFFHDSAACLVRDGVIVSAAQEERFTRIKHDSSFPKEALRSCLQSGGITVNEVDHFVFFEKPFIKFERILETYLSITPAGYKSFAKAIPIWVGEKLFQKNLILQNIREVSASDFDESKLLFSEHHLSHAASAFYPSPFQEACILTVDGVGEWTTASASVGRDNQIEILQEIHFPHSLGLLYSAFTYYLGFKVNSGEYKVMGLAPYGAPKYTSLILDNLIDVKDDGSFRLDMKYFDYCGGLTMTSPLFNDLFEHPNRTPEQELTQFHMDVASSLQVVTEEIMLKLTRSLYKQTKVRNLCLAGGVALNCVANGKIYQDGQFENIWVQPAAGDAGGALGAALYAHFGYLGSQRQVQNVGKDTMRGSYLGINYTQDNIEKSLDNIGGLFRTEKNCDAYIEEISDALVKGLAVGWFQGGMEFGPRALGGRSIIASPLEKDMQKKLNLKVKYRESFRPFAPAILAEDVSEWFEYEDDSPYMLMVANLKDEHQIKMSESEQKLFGIDKLNIPRSKVPAITHVDYSARLQTVDGEYNEIFYKLLKSFKIKTGCPILVNTSFNVRGEPIVCTPEQAFNCFMGTELDVLAIGQSILYKDEQDPKLKKSYKDEFALD